MSEAELHILKSRLQSGILNKARRGRFTKGFTYAGAISFTSWPRALI